MSEVKSGPAPTPLPLQARKALLVRLRDVAVKAASALFKQALDQVDDSLFGISESSDTGAGRGQFFDAMRELRLQRPAMERTFQGEIANRFAAFARARGAATEALAEVSLEDSDSMSLVDEGELEETIAINAMVGKARTRYNSALYAMNLRLAELVGAKEIDDASNPLGPEGLCAALRSALHAFKADIAVRLIILKLFDRHVIGDLNQLYDDVNRLMAGAGLLPKVKYTLPSRGKDALPPPRSVLEGDDAVAGGDEAGAAALDPAAREVMSSLSTLMSARRQAGPGIARPAGPSLSGAELVAALSILQASLQRARELQAESGTQGPTPQQQVEQVKLDLLAQLRGLGVNQPENRVATADEDAIDLASMLFQFVVQDRNLPSEIQAILCKLQIPYVRIALKDRHLFAQREHPARRLLNAMAVASVGWTRDADPDGTLLERLGGIVDRIIGEYNDDFALFEKLLEEFEAGQAQTRKRAEVAEQRASEAAEGRDKLVTARRSAEDAVRARTAERTLPPLVLHTLEHSWTQFLVLTHLRNGPESREWKSGVSLVDALIWAVQPKEDADQLARLRGLVPQIQAALRRGLGVVGFQEHDAERLIHGVTTLIESVQTPAVEVEPTRRAAIDEAERAVEAVAERQRKIAPREEEPEPAKPAVPLADDDAWVQKVRDLKLGTWMEFTFPGKEPERAKLSWISKISARFLFVNRKGLKVAERNVVDLAHELRAGRVAVLEDGPLCDRAVDAILTRLRTEHDLSKPLVFDATPGSPA